MNLEEKRKKITELCQNLDNKIFATIKQRFPDNENTVCLDAHPVRENYNIDDEEEYNNLIDFLKQHQKELELYTLEDILKTVIDACNDFGHNNNYKNWLKDFIEVNIKPYKK